MIDCAIIKDLLPAYVSGLCSEETRALVDEHIGECASCREKITDTRQRVASQLREKDAKSVNIFKRMKKKMLMRNALVAGAAAILVAFLAFFVGVKVIDYKPIAYFDGLARVELNYADYYNSENNISITISDPSKNPEITGKIPVLDIRCAKNYYSTNMAGRTIVRDGERVNVQYLCFLDNILSKSSPLRPNGQNVFRLVWADLIGDEPVRTEVYYFTDVESARNSSLSDEDFDNLRHMGTLIWSGVVG